MKKQFLLWSLAAFVGLAPTTLAQSGSISATPAEVLIPPGQNVGTSVIGWTGSGAAIFHVTVQCGSGTESLFATSGAGTYTQDAPWITPGSSCRFRLRRDTTAGPELASVLVTGIQPTGSIAANPQTVLIPGGQAVGTTTLSWTSSGYPQVHVLVACNGGALSLFASSGPGAANQTAPWITVGSSCLFQLRGSTVNGPVLGEVTVTGVSSQPATGTLSATPPLVPVKKNATYGTAHLSWTSSATTVELRRVAVNGTETSLGNFAANGETTTTSIEAGQSYLFRLYGNGQLLATTPAVQGVRLLTTERGGSNHAYYRNPPPVPPAAYNGANYNYGILLHYHEPGVRATVQGQLKQMFDNGQRTLRVFVHFLHAPGQTITSTPAESSRKCRTPHRTCPPENVYFLPLQYQQNLRDYLADIRAAKFERVMVALGPQWINDFGQCASKEIPQSYRDHLYAGSPLVNELFEEAWGVAKEVRAIVVQSGLPYLVDLGNEYMPPINLADFGQCAKDIIEGTPTFQGYLRFLWGRWVSNYGPQDSVGFSVIVNQPWDAENRLARMPQFLSPMPPVISIHSYTGQAGDILAGLNQARAVTLGFGQGEKPWIIGETNNRSTASAGEIRNFLLQNPQQEIRYLLQWPGFNCTTESECLPLDFNTFASQGF